MEPARLTDRLDVAILTITAMAGAVAVAFNDREAVRFLQERPAGTSLLPWRRHSGFPFDERRATSKLCSPLQPWVLALQF